MIPGWLFLGLGLMATPITLIVGLVQQDGNLILGSVIWGSSATGG